MLHSAIKKSLFSASRPAPALQKASLNFLARGYHKNVISHYEKRQKRQKLRKVGSLPKHDIEAGTGLVGAPACGDVMKPQTCVDDKVTFISGPHFVPPSPAYLKGYKLDSEKMRQTLTKLPDETWDIYWYDRIVECIMIPETEYRYVACGLEADGEFSLIFVKDDGDDEAALKGTPNVELPESLSKEVLEVLTPGVWPSADF